MRIRKPTERWFKVPKDPDGAEIKIRTLTPGERFAIVDQALTQEIEYDDDGKAILKQENNKSLDRELTAQAAVVDWKKVYGENGKALKCTPENIATAVNRIDGFFAFVRECMMKLDDDLTAEKRAQEKNSPTT